MAGKGGNDVGLTGPSVSIVVPCYNGARFLRAALESALNQTASPLEAIVVDDGSTDDSAAIAESFGYPVRVIRQSNQGESVARNVGISVAKGDWIAFLDADDLWEPNKLERQAEIAFSPGCTFACVYTAVYAFDEAGRVGFTMPPQIDALPDARVRMLFDWSVQPSSALVRRDLARRVGFPEKVRHGEDGIFFAQLRGFGPFFRIPEKLTGYRRYPSQQTGSRNHALERLRSVHQWFLENAHRYSESERTFFANRAKLELAQQHDLAYWMRQRAGVRAWRGLHTELFGKGGAVPPSFSRFLFPAPVYWAKDFMDRLFPSRRPRNAGLHS